jgi:hypothetical protein
MDPVPAGLSTNDGSGCDDDSGMSLSPGAGVMVR